MKKYGVSKWDREIITGMIREAYFQLQESYKMSRIFEEYVMEKNPQLYEEFIKYMFNDINQKVAKWLNDKL